MDSSPLPSRHPETFYVSLKLLKEIKQRMDDTPQTSSRRQDSDTQNNNDDIGVKNANKHDILQHLRGFKTKNH